MPDCEQCRMPGSDELRALWGCDAPAEFQVFATTCSTCSGAGCHDPDECPTCCEPLCRNGSRHWHRCPSSVIRERLTPDFQSFIRAYHHYDHCGGLPARGAWLDQPCRFSAAVDVLNAERGAWQKVEADHYRRMADRAQAQQARSHARQGR